MTPGGLGVLIVLLLLFCLWHAHGALGIRSTAAIFAIAVMTSWAFEEVGVLTGLVYGRYHYTSTLGPWIGSVPALIPLAWFALAYPTMVLADLAWDRWSLGARGGRGHLVGPALLGAVLMAAWDVVLDPILSGPVYRAWTWEPGGADAGIPVQNSLGWIATALAIYLLYGSMARHRVFRPGAERPGRPRAAPATSGRRTDEVQRETGLRPVTSGHDAGRPELRGIERREPGEGRPVPVSREG